MNLEQAYQRAEYLAHTYCYPEFLHGELSQKESQRTDQSRTQVCRSGERAPEVSSLFQSKHATRRR
jgi:hypothetical protein